MVTTIRTIIDNPLHVPLDLGWRLNKDELLIVQQRPRQMKEWLDDVYLAGNRNIPIRHDSPTLFEHPEGSVDHMLFHFRVLDIGLIPNKGEGDIACNSLHVAMPIRYFFKGSCTQEIEHQDGTMTSFVVWFAKDTCLLLAGAIRDIESNVSMGGGLEYERGDLASIGANISFPVLSCRVRPDEGGFANTTAANEDELEFMRDRRLFKKVLIERRPTKMSNNNRIARRPMTKPCGSHAAPDYIANR